MQWIQKTVQLKARKRGFHLITEDLLAELPELAQFTVGIAHLFIQHTSASLAINENADPEVPTDMEAHFNLLAPENAAHYTHTYEGADDMPAHLKAMLIGSSLSVPVTNGRFNLGTWQGIYLCEHRSHGGSRKLVITVWGEAKG